MVAQDSSLKKSTIRLISAGAVKPVVNPLTDKFERESGNLVYATFGTVGETSKRLIAESADVVIVSAEAIASISKGLVVADSLIDIAKVRMGVCVPQGAPMPDISSVYALKRTLLSAHKFAYTNPSSGGTGGKHVAWLLQYLGIAKTMARKSVLGPNGVGTCELVARGKAEIALSMESEIRSVKGVMWVGPLPIHIQKVTTYTVGLTATSQDVDTAREFISFITRPEFKQMFTDAGLDYRE